MTLDDLLAREAIRATMARYTTAGDRLRVDEFAAVFTEDGVLQSEGVDPADTFRYEGRDAIRGWLARWLEPPAEVGATHQASFVRHHLSTCDIDLTGADTARARTYWVAYTDIGPDHAGYYLDSFARVDGDWRIAHRKVRLDWRAKDSLFTSAIENSRG